MTRSTYPRNFTRLMASAAIGLLLALVPTTAATAASGDGPVVITPAATGPILPTFLSPEKPARGVALKRAKIVDFATRMDAGSVLVNTRERALYLVLGNGKAARYSIAVPKKGFGWSGIEHISAKQHWPDWRPPATMRKRRPDLPVFMAGGPDNPLGARALYLGSSIYRIHGTNEPASIGKAASSGCIRMLNEDVSELYEHVRLGAMVVVI
jgi:lipoprotein-anchoring transpeptidase ErfK/SrfK